LDWAAMGPSRCPKCDAVLSPADIDIAAGIATCPSCHAGARLSEVLDHREGLEIARLGEGAAPPGCGIVREGESVRIRAPMRGPAVTALSVIFAVVWNALTIGMFVALLNRVRSGPVAGAGAQKAIIVWILFLSLFLPVGVITAFMALTAL